MDKAQAVSLGLFVAWCINDAEELVTLADSSRLVAERAPAFLPLPEAFRRGGFSKKHTYHGIATMGVLVGTASLAGYVTHGRSPLFRGALVAFGVHGCTHVASALAMRKYTSGVVTAALTTIPYWHWARRTLREAGLSDTDRSAVVVAVLAWPSLLAVHVGTALRLGDASFGEPRS